MSVLWRSHGMWQVNLRIACLSVGPDAGGWFRFGQHGPGFRWTCRPPLFSERMGLRRSLKLGRWRVLALPGGQHG